MIKIYGIVCEYKVASMKMCLFEKDKYIYAC